MCDMSVSVREMKGPLVISVFPCVGTLNSPAFPSILMRHLNDVIYKLNEWHENWY